MPELRLIFSGGLVTIQGSHRIAGEPADLTTVDTRYEWLSTTMKIILPLEPSPGSLLP